MCPSVKWAGVLLAFARSILGTEVCGVLGTGFKKQAAVTILLLLLLENKRDSSREGQACLPREAPGRVWPAGLDGGITGTEQKAFSGEKRLLQSGNGQLERSAVARTRAGVVLGRLPGPVGSQAAGRWSPSGAQPSW